MVVALGDTEADPDATNGRKPDPVQASPLLAHESVDEAPGAMLAGLALNESVGAVDDAASRPPWVVHPVRSSLKDTSHHVIESALSGPPMTVPWFPCASSPIDLLPVDGVDQTEILPVVATVMPVASVGEADELAACPVIDSRETIRPSLIVKSEFVDMCSHPR